MGFDVLKESWIPVIYKDGKVDEVGIMTCLINAEQIKTISNTAPYEKIAIIRLLTAFISDAYMLENANDREKLYEQRV